MRVHLTTFISTKLHSPQGHVVKRLRFGGTFAHHFVADLLQNVPVK